MRPGCLAGLSGENIDRQEERAIVATRGMTGGLLRQWQGLLPGQSGVNQIAARNCIVSDRRAE
ncbi:MAG TPA: hypothetical protein DIT28_14460 [Oxalobacteraceae bacterium]|nr:hypothetical protein [Oxalobacteraceae bacterium]HCN90358.1 hypothetical protein [Oxalobacteraceae bacterium]